MRRGNDLYATVQRTLHLREPVDLAVRMLNRVSESAAVDPACRRSSAEDYAAEVIEVWVAEKFRECFGTSLGEFWRQVEDLAPDARTVFVASYVDRCEKQFAAEAQGIARWMLTELDKLAALGTRRGAREGARV